MRKTRIEHRTAVSLAPPKKRIDFFSDLRAALQIGASRKSVIAVGRAYAQNIKFCIEGRVAASLAPKETFCGLRTAGSTWIRHPSQGSVASG